MKNIYLLGATGSIGQQTIELIEEFPDEFNLIAISGFSNLEKIIEIGSKFSLRLIACKDEKDASVLKNVFPDVKIVVGEKGLVELSTFQENDKDGVLINALVGMVGLKPTIPQYAAGLIVEPEVCDPMANGTISSATAAAEPLDDPPGVCCRLCGLRVLPAPQ